MKFSSLTVNLWDECQAEYFSPKLPSCKRDFCGEDANFKNEEHIPQKSGLHFDLWLGPVQRSQVPFKDTGLEGLTGDFFSVTHDFLFPKSRHHDFHICLRSSYVI